MRAWLLLLVALAGCVSPLKRLTVVTQLELPGARIALKSDGQHPDDVAKLERALAAAVPRLQAWGGLSVPVTVYMLPDHDALERAVGRFGYDWLRAWARYDDVLFQRPATWGARQEEVNELVLHELTHCALFQRAGSPESWHARGIPLWFREGMAVWTARQGRLYPSHEDVASWLASAGNRNVFRDGEALSADFYGPVYGYSLHAFTFLLRRFGEARVVATLDEMQRGARFDAAFASALGLTPRQFQRDFENYLRWRAFRGTARPPGRAEPVLRRWREGRQLGRELDPGAEGDLSRPAREAPAPGPDGLAPRG